MTVRVDIQREYVDKISQREALRKLLTAMFDIINQERTRHGLAAITKKQFITYMKSK